MKKRINSLLLLLLLAIHASGQTDSTAIERVQQRNYRIVLGIETGVYLASMAGLYKLWYADYPMTRFHFYNDNDGWLQVDKTGHFLSAYRIGLLGVDMMKWGGIPRKKAIWNGGLYGSIYLTTIEILDGFSDGWGCSWGDLVANSSGTALVVAQELLWDEQRIQAKFSFFPTPSNQGQSHVAGNTISQQLIKDYNAQTYWLSANLHSFMPQTKIPSFLNLALGYGGTNMIGGWRNPKNSGFERYRQFYLGFDVDLRKIKTRKKWLDRTLKLLSVVKVPAPAIRYSEDGKWKFFPLHLGQ